MYNDLDNKTEGHFFAEAEAFQQAIELLKSIDEKIYLAVVNSKLGELYSEVDVKKSQQIFKKVC